MNLNKTLSSPLIALVTGCLWLSAVEAAEAVSPQQAEQLYRDNCAVCHGDSGDGQTRARFGLDPKPRDFTAPRVAAELSRERMIKSVTHGKTGTAMVGWQGRLSSTEIEGVVDHIRNRFMKLAQDVKPVVVAKKDVPRGQQIYEEHCRVCHGDRGNGATWTNSVLSPPPRNFTAPQSRRVLTRKRMLASVTYGRKSTAMMSFRNRLSQADIEAVVDYIRATFMKGPVVADAGMADLSGPGAPAHNGHGRAPSSIGSHGMAPKRPGEVVEAKVDMDAPFPGELKGDFERGRDFYLRNCSSCHGTRGDGLGPRSGFINPKPRNFLHADSRQNLNRPALFQSIVVGKVGTVMPAWGKVIGPQQVADVAEFVFQDFIHPNPDSIQPQPEKEPADKKKAP